MKRTGPLSKRSADAELKHGGRIELPVGERAMHRQFHFRLELEAHTGLNGNSRRPIDPIAAADEHRGASKDVLLPVEPAQSAECRNPMRVDRVRSAAFSSDEAPVRSPVTFSYSGTRAAMLPNRVKL